MAVNFSGKTALVTGGGSGIGQAAALRFGKEGANVIVADINRAAADETVKEIAAMGANAIAVTCDVSQAVDVEAMVERAIAEYGYLDMAFNVAGIPGPLKLIADLQEEDWDRTIDVNLKGTFLCMKYEITAMLKKGGSIVNTSSAGVLKPAWPQPDYQASKAGILALTRSAANSYGDRNIRVNALLPGVTLTPALRDNVEEGSNELQRLGDMMPIKRIATVDEIANAAVWLCSNEASYVTGSSLVVDGGMQIT